MGIYPITEYLDSFPDTIIRQFHCQFTSIPIAQYSDIPIITFAPSHNDILPDFTIEHESVIPNSRNPGNKADTFLFTHIIGRRITKHVKRRIEYDIFCKLMTTGALTHRITPVREISAFDTITHRSLRIIHRAGHHTDVW